jgi:hypothetical protein
MTETETSVGCAPEMRDATLGPVGRHPAVGSLWLRVCGHCGVPDYDSAWGRPSAVDRARPFACAFCPSTTFVVGQADMPTLTVPGRANGPERRESLYIVAGGHLPVRSTARLPLGGRGPEPMNDGEAVDRAS